ncbi:MFS transporter [Streptomyces sp. RPT161]|uniref:MFS transporter n=1 Tax=Streptomyces sp. RPT161 TaxID=3015993 RepID=UPI0022B8BE32|nr:MFS transporter [Streptomyces sp. RPT161]
MSLLRNTAETLRRLGPGNHILFLTTLTLQSGSVVLPFLAAYLVNEHRYATGTVGLVVACYGVGALMADLSSGPLLRHVPARKLMTAGLAGNAIAVTALPYLRSPALLALAVVVWGFCYEIFMPASYLETVRLSPPRDLKIAFSFNRLAINLGMGAGPLVGAVLFPRWPIALFVLNALAAAAAGLYLATRGATRVEPQPDGKQPDVPESRAATQTAARAGGDRRIWAVLLLSVPIHYAYALPLTFVSVYVPRDLHLPDMWVGLVFAVSAGSIVLFEIPLNTAMRDVGSVPALTMGYALAASGFALMGAVRSGPALLLATLVWTLAEMVVFPELTRCVSLVSSPATASRNMGMYAAVMNAGLMAAPQLALAVTAHAGPASPWYLAGAAIAVPLPVLLLLCGRRLAPARRPDGERPPRRDGETRVRTGG